jgi:Ca2+-binding RTX toxin-like protein
MTIQPDGAITGLPTGTITDQVFSPDGHTLYTARNGTITAYDVSTANVVGSWTIGTQLGGIDISADGHSIVAVEMTPGTATGTWPNITAHYFVYQLDLTSGTSKTFDLPVTAAYPEGYGDVSFLSDGKVLLAGGGQWQPLTTLDLSTGATTTTGQTFEGPTLTSSADDSHVLVSPLNISDAPLFIYTTGSGITASHQLYADNIQGYNAGVQAISPDGSLSVEGVSLAVYDSNLHLVAKLSDRFPFGAAGLAFSPDGSKLYVLDPMSNEVFVLSTSSWDVLGGYPVGASVTGQSYYTFNGTAPATHYGNALLVSSDGTHLAVDTAVSVQIIDLSKAVSDSGTSAGNDILIGDSAPNILYGFEGNDALDGKGGADTMFGGPGDDIYYVDNGSDNVVEKPNEGNDTIYSSVASYALPGSVETLVLAAGGVTAYGNDDANRLVGNDSNNQLFGSAGDDTLVGNGGNDVLDGGTGNDTMQGGSGNDTYYVESPADVVQEDAGNGIDKVFALVSYTLSANVENLELSSTSYPLVGHGNGLDNVLIGNGAEDALYGLAGNDTLIGATGRQYLYGGAGSDTLTGGGGDDIFIGTAAELNGDTITDFTSDDTILISDATISGFTFSLNGNTLTYSGGSITLNNISGHFRADAAVGGGVQLSIAPYHAPNDFNGDHVSDVLWRNATTGTITDWLGNSSGGFTGNTDAAWNNASSNWHIVGTGDFNGDGRADILWKSDSGEVTNWLGSANGGFTGNIANADNNVGAGWQVAGTGDFNGDGRSDVLWRNSTTGTITDWLGQANGSFIGNTDAAWNNAASSWHIVGTGDFNGDGRTDILWKSDGGEVTNWLGTPNGGFAGNIANADNNVGAGWAVAGTGDVNGDGRDDVIWRNSTTGNVTDWLGQANGSFTGNTGYAWNNASTSWHIVQVGDFNGDGHADILWQSDSGEVTNWLGNANGGFTGNIVYADNNVDAGWQVMPQAHLI